MQPDDQKQQSMIFDFVITLKRRSHKWVDMISHLLLFISVVSFGMFYFELKLDYKYLAICLAITVLWIVSIFKKRNTGSTLYRLPLMLCGVGWLMEPNQNLWFSALYFVASLFEKQVKFPEEIGFSKEEIVFNTFPKKRYSWKDIMNVVLKDNIITVDFKNNKLVQKEIDESVSKHVETEFNEFCKGRLSGVL